MENRIIKFRVWDNVDYMSTPFALQYIQDKYIQFTSDCIIMQFTGLHDKNGKEIYEGDIINTVTGKPMVIGWSKRFASFTIERDGWAFKHFFGEAMESNDIEVIGNIYENPELLKI